MLKDTYAKGAIFSALGGVCWALSGTFGQSIFEYKGLDAVWLTSTRLISAGFIMLILCFAKQGKAIFDIWKDKKEIFEILLYGILGMAGVQVTYFLSIQYSNAATGTIVQYTGSVIIVLWVALRSLKLPNKFETISVIFAVIGIFILSTHGDINNFVISKLALAWGLLSAALMAFYSIFPRRMLKKWGTLMTNGWGMFLGGIVMLFVRQPWDLQGRTFDLGTFLAASGVVVFGTIMSFFLYLDGIRIIGSNKAVLYACVEPLTAAIIGIIWFNIAFGLIDWIGAAFIVSTVFIISLAPKEVEQDKIPARKSK